MYDRYESPLSSRYASPEMLKLFPWKLVSRHGGNYG